MLTGAKAGDNAQVLKAAEASRLDFVEKRIAFTPEALAGKPAVLPDLGGIDMALSDALEAPWPDVVLTIGRHLSRVALWIRQQSGGRTRLALLNAPKGHAADFDLVVLPPWYRGGGQANVLDIAMPLIGIDSIRLAAARVQFADSLAAMPRPLHVLLVGGDMGMRRLEPAFARQVISTMQRGFAAQGSIYAATSRRTPPAVARALAGALRPQDRLFVWGSGAENPYLGLLAHGDDFTVTADSLSMLVEVARLGKPLVIAAPPPPRGLAGLAYRASNLFRPRDLGKAIRILTDGGHAVPLGEAPRPPRAALPDDTEAVAQRLRQLAGATG